MGHGIKALALVAMLTGPLLADAASVIVGDKEWRQPAETTGFAWIDIQKVCNIDTGECSGMLGGLDLTGWTWASNADVQGLFNTLIPRDPLTLPAPYGHTFMESDPTDYLAALSGDMFVPLPVISGTDDYSITVAVAGLTREWSYGYDYFAWTPMIAARLQTAPDQFGNTSWGFVTMERGALLNSPRVFVGSWLFRPYEITAVPEPGTLALFGLGLIGLGVTRRKDA